MFVQIGRDIINTDYITAIRVDPAPEIVKVWLNAPIGPRFFYWSGDEYHEFMRWLNFLSAAESPQHLGAYEEEDHVP